MKLCCQFLVDVIIHLLDVHSVNGTIFQHCIVFFLESVGNGTLELETPPMNVLGVALMSFAKPFVVREGEGDGISVQWDIAVPVCFFLVVGDVGSGVAVHVGSDLLIGPIVIPDVGHHDWFPWFRKKMCKEHCIFLSFDHQGVGDACVVHVPMG